MQRLKAKSNKQGQDEKLYCHDNLCHTRLDWCQPWMCYHDFSPDFYHTIVILLTLRKFWYRIINCTKLNNFWLYGLIRERKLLKFFPGNGGVRINRGNVQKDEKKNQWVSIYIGRVYVPTYTQVQTSPTPWCLGSRTSGMVLLHLHKLLCSAVVFRLLRQLSPLHSWWRSGRCGWVGTLQKMTLQKKWQLSPALLHSTGRCRVTLLSRSEGSENSNDVYWKIFQWIEVELCWAISHQSHFTFIINERDHMTHSHDKGMTYEDPKVCHIFTCSFSVVCVYCS